jgi:hypothetical protein
VAGKKITLLQTELDVLLNSQSSNSWNTEIALEAYAKASCRVLCNKVYATFPREIRDMIFRHTLPGHAITVPAPVYYDDRDGERNSTLQGHLIDDEFVGKHVAKEIGEAYYRYSTFLFHHSYTSMLDFRVLDRYNLKLIPADFILNLVVRIVCDSYDWPTLKPRIEDANGAGGWGGGGGGGWGTPYFRDVLSNLEPTFGFKVGTKITIDLTVDEKRLEDDITQEQWEWDNVVPLIFPTLRRLSVAGYKLKVRLNSDDFVLTAVGTEYTLEQWSVVFEKVRSALSRQWQLLTSVASREESREDSDVA